MIIGAGSFNFTCAISRDIFTFPALADSNIVLVDIPEGVDRMEAARIVIEKTIQKGGYPGSVYATFNRSEALAGADAVMITIRNDLTIDALQAFSDFSVPLLHCSISAAILRSMLRRRQCSIIPTPWI